MKRAQQSGVASRSFEASSVSVIVGSPGAGKTTLALHLAASIVLRTNWPVIVLDLGAVSTFKKQPHVESAQEALRVAICEHTHAYWTPQDLDDCEALFAGAGAAGRLVLLIDESHYLLARQRDARELMRLMRAHRHREVHVILTTQALSNDVPQEALACAPTVYVMKTTAPTSLARIEREFGLDPAQVRTLERGAYFRVSPDYSIDVVGRDGRGIAKAQPQARERGSDVQPPAAEPNSDHR